MAATELLRSARAILAGLPSSLSWAVGMPAGRPNASRCVPLLSATPALPDRAAAAGAAGAAGQAPRQVRPHPERSGGPLWHRQARSPNQPWGFRTRCLPAQPECVLVGAVGHTVPCFAVCYADAQPTDFSQHNVGLQAPRCSTRCTNGCTSRPPRWSSERRCWLPRRQGCCSSSRPAGTASRSEWGRWLIVW